MSTDRSVARRLNLGHTRNFVQTSALEMRPSTGLGPGGPVWVLIGPSFYFRDRYNLYFLQIRLILSLSPCH